jgi:hypothetical protein
VSAAVRIVKLYLRADGTVRSATVFLPGYVEVTVDVTTGVVSYASDWTVDGDTLAWGRNYGPSTYGHTDVVLVPSLLKAVQAAVEA